MRLNAEQINEFVNTVLNTQIEKDFSWIDARYLIDVWRLNMNAGTGVAYGIEDEGGPIGFLLGLHAVEPLTGVKKAFEYLWMASPEKRSGGAALQLLKEFEDGAKQDGCVNVVLGCHAAFKPQVLRRFYSRLGYDSVSESFQKNL